MSSERLNNGPHQYLTPASSETIPLLDSDNLSSDERSMRSDDETGSDDFEQQPHHHNDSGIDSLNYAEADGSHRQHQKEEPETLSAFLREFLLAKGSGPRASRVVRWAYGVGSHLDPPKTWLRFRTPQHGPVSLEPVWLRWTRPYTSPIILAVLIAAYVIGLSFFVRAQWYQVPSSSFAECTDSFWSPNNGCGINGTSCEPFVSTVPTQIRCPAGCPSVILANQRAVGDLEVVYQPLVVGGGDENVTYRGDSWVCVAAAHAGLVSASRGGCAAIELVGTFKNFIGVDRHGVSSVPFPSTFPLSYRFLPESGLSQCFDMRNEALVMNVLITVILSLILRPKPLVLFWCLVCIGFWHITFFSDPQSAPPPISTAIGTFLPTIFVCYAFWRSTFRFILPAFSNLPIERTIWMLAGYWPGVLTNLTFDKVPIDRLVPSDIRARPGGLVSIIIIAIVVVFIVVNQIRVIRKTGQLPIYLVYYLTGGLVIMILALIPGFTFRLHHYVFAMVLLPGLGFPTRVSLFLSAFLLGMFLDGVSRWGFAAILQTAAELQRDAPLGSALPEFTNQTFPPMNTTSDLSLFSSFLSSLASSSTSPANSTISWTAIDPTLATNEGWDGFSLLIDDVEAYAGTALNFSISALDWSVRHFFRLAYTNSGTPGDYTRAATIFPNGTYVSPISGPS
ncbi:hypothetical protein DL93DRAFT_2090319 [Clavulina sp. PMI_390]|nr:hypothetical protein DL93DRAFT_2090319 [Clavulina sp. PMI_390]